MGRKKAAVSAEAPAEIPEIQSKTWRLSDPGMDLLERAGLAGLYMALQAATRAGVDLSPLQWTDADLTADSVTVRWTGPAKPAFVKLMAWAWQVKDGLFYFPAVHDERARVNWWERVSMHNGLLGTCFQNNKVQPRGAATVRLVQIDEEVTLKFDFLPVVAPKPLEDVADLFNKEGALTAENVKLSSWVAPGNTTRYPSETTGTISGWKNLAWSGSVERAFVLMLSPTTCFYLKLQGAGGNWICVVPDVRDCETFSRIRQRAYLPLDSVDIASLGDAGLRCVAMLSTRKVRKDFHAGCRAIAIGKTKYFHVSNSIRKAVLDVGDRLGCVKRYRILQQVLPNRFQRIKLQHEPFAAPQPEAKKTRKPKESPTKKQSVEPQPSGWYKLPTGRGRIADNLVNGRRWYENLFVPMPWDEKELEQQRKQSETGFSTERVWFDALAKQGRKFMRLIQEDNMWDNEAEQLFVKSFWETLDSLYRQEADAVNRGGSRSAPDRWEDMNSDIRRQLLQAKTRTLLRGVIAALLAKAGRTKTLGANLPAIWRLIDHPDLWQKGRDLALLAMASHRKRGAREENDEVTTGTQQENDE